MCVIYIHFEFGLTLTCNILLLLNRVTVDHHQSLKWPVKEDRLPILWKLLLDCKDPYG